MFKLDVRGLEKSYGARGLKALKSVTLEVASSERVALLGRSGSGKSTLLRCINRLVEPDAGDVILDGVNITKLGRRELRACRRRIGMIFQEFNLVNRMSVIDNVLSGRAGYVSTWRCWFRSFAQDDVLRAEQLLERVGLAEHRFKRADELSGGQRQRVGIARALMQDPKLLLADEPTASLDPEIGREIMELLIEISDATKIPLIISMHDVGLATRFVERIVALKDGAKIFDGSVAGVDLKSIYRDAVETDGGAGAIATGRLSPAPA